MQISVIIPVYNAEKYVIDAVESALAQPEVGEVVLAEDKSPDNSLKICQDLEKEYEKVRLLRHPDGDNHGAGATRNLGIRNAKFDLIAFLDADDYYLPGRFKVAGELFETYHDIDGVYEAIGMHFHNDQARKKWFASGEGELTTIKERIDSRHLFEAMSKGGKGYLHLDGLVVKKSIFGKCGYFFKHLRLHQDTAMFFQMAECGKLIPGRLDTPVAMRGIHAENRILSEYDRRQTTFILWQALFHWAYNKHIRNNRLIALFHNYMYSALRLAKKNTVFSEKSFALMKESIRESFRHPYLFARAGMHFIQNRPLFKAVTNNKNRQ